MKYACVSPPWVPLCWHQKMETPLLSSAILDKLLLLHSHPPFLGNLEPMSSFEITGTIRVTEMDSQWVRQALLKHVALQAGHSLHTLPLTPFKAAGTTKAPKLPLILLAKCNHRGSTYTD